MIPIALAFAGFSTFTLINERDTASCWLSSWETDKAIVTEKLVQHKNDQKLHVQYYTRLELIEHEIARHTQWKNSWNPFYRWMTTDPIVRYDVRLDEIDAEARKRIKFI